MKLKSIIQLWLMFITGVTAVLADVYTIRLPAGRADHQIYFQSPYGYADFTNAGLVEPAGAGVTDDGYSLFIHDTEVFPGQGPLNQTDAWLYDRTTDEYAELDPYMTSGGPVDNVIISNWVGHGPASPGSSSSSSSMAWTGVHFILPASTSDHTFVLYVHSPGQTSTYYPLSFWGYNGLIHSTTLGQAFESPASRSISWTFVPTGSQFYLVDLTTGKRAPSNRTNLTATAWTDLNEVPQTKPTNPQPGTIALEIPAEVLGHNSYFFFMGNNAGYWGELPIQSLSVLNDPFRLRLELTVDAHTPFYTWNSSLQTRVMFPGDDNGSTIAAGTTFYYGSRPEHIVSFAVGMERSSHSLAYWMESYQMIFPIDIKTQEVNIDLGGGNSLSGFFNAIINTRLPKGLGWSGCLVDLTTWEMAPNDQKDLTNAYWQAIPGNLPTRAVIFILPDTESVGSRYTLHTGNGYLEAMEVQFGVINNDEVNYVTGQAGVQEEVWAERVSDGAVSQPVILSPGHGPRIVDARGTITPPPNRDMHLMTFRLHEPVLGMGPYLLQVQHDDGLKTPLFPVTLNNAPGSYNELTYLDENNNPVSQPFSMATAWVDFNQGWKVVAPSLSLEFPQSSVLGTQPILPRDTSIAGATTFLLPKERDGHFILMGRPFPETPLDMIPVSYPSPTTYQYMIKSFAGTPYERTSTLNYVTYYPATNVQDSWIPALMTYPFYLRDFTSGNDYSSGDYIFADQTPYYSSYQNGDLTNWHGEPQNLTLTLPRPLWSHDLYIHTADGLSFPIKPVVMNGTWSPDPTQAAFNSYQTYTATAKCPPQTTWWVWDATTSLPGPANQTDYSNYATWPQAWAVFDQDQDGMSDDFETFFGLKPKDASDKLEDFDHDTLTNYQEFLADKNPRRAEDADGDGLFDYFEIAAGLDPLVQNDSNADTDTDGVTNIQEQMFGMLGNSTDSNNDGIPDSWAYAHRNQFHPSVTHGSVDSDHDGLSNLEEYLRGTDPYNEDTDGDKSPDSEDPAPGVEALAAPGHSQAGFFNGAGPDSKAIYGPVVVAVERGASLISGVIQGLEDRWDEFFNVYDITGYATGGAFTKDKLGGIDEPQGPISMATLAGYMPSMPNITSFLNDSNYHARVRGWTRAARRDSLVSNLFLDQSNYDMSALISNDYERWKNVGNWDRYLQLRYSSEVYYEQLGSTTPSDYVFNQSHSEAKFLLHRSPAQPYPESRILMLTDGTTSTPQIINLTIPAGATESPEVNLIPSAITLPSLPARRKGTSSVVNASFLSMDLAVDSDNNDGLNLPKRAAVEDAKEDYQSAQKPANENPGKYIKLSTGDFDKDDIPDFADGMDIFGGSGADKCSKFVPMVADLTAIRSSASAKVKFEYSEANPTGITKQIVPNDIPKWSPGNGDLRLWKKNGNEARKVADIKGSGDFVRANTEYSIEELGADTQGSLTLYVEAVRKSTTAADKAVTMFIKFDSQSQWIEADKVRFTAIPRVLFGSPYDNLTPLVGSRIKPAFEDNTDAEGQELGGTVSGSNSDSLNIGHYGPHPDAGSDETKDRQRLAICLQTGPDTFTKAEDGIVLLVADGTPRGGSSTTAAYGSNSSPVDGPEDWEAQFERILFERYEDADPRVEDLERDAFELWGWLYGGRSWEYFSGRDVWRDGSKIFVEDSLTPEQAADAYYAFLKRALPTEAQGVNLNPVLRYFAELYEQSGEDRSKVGQHMAKHWELVEFTSGMLQDEYIFLPVGFALEGVLQIRRVNSMTFYTEGKVFAVPLIRRNWARGNITEHDTLVNSLGFTRNYGKNAVKVTGSVNGQAVDCIPDAIRSQWYIEVKDWKSLSATRQIRAEFSAAQNANKSVCIIITTRNRKLSPQLMQLIEQESGLLLRRNVNTDGYELWNFQTSAWEAVDKLTIKAWLQ